MRRERAADWGAWLTIAMCTLIIVLSAAAVAWRVAGHGPIFPLEGGQDQQEQKVTDQTVAPAVTYQPEAVAP